MIASVDAFTNKLRLLKRQLAREDITHFPCLKYLGKDCQSAHEYIPSIDRLIEQFTERFVDFRRYQSEFDLISNPIIFDIDTASANLQLELLSLQSDPIIKADFQTQISKRDLFTFYKTLPREHYPNLRRRAQRMFSFFGSTYICEQTFSLLKLTKSKVRSRLTDEHVAASLRLSTTELKPDLMKLVHQKQPQKSH